jgi:hypothetical protein
MRTTDALRNRAREGVSRSAPTASATMLIAAKVHRHIARGASCPSTGKEQDVSVHGAVWNRQRSIDATGLA